MPTCEWETEELLEEQVGVIRAAGVNVAEAHLREGRPAEKIVKLADELDVDLILVGSRGVGTVKRLVMGSVSEGVVSLASCPVLVMRGGEDAWPPTTVVVGDDSSTEAKKAGELAAAIGRLVGARTLLVRAYPVSMLSIRRAYVRRSEMLLKKLSEHMISEHMKERAAELEQVLDKLPEIRVAVADSAVAIQEAAEEYSERALVAVGRRGLDAVKRFASGSVSTDVLRAVSGPVLIVPRLGNRANHLVYRS